MLDSPLQEQPTSTTQHQEAYQNQSLRLFVTYRFGRAQGAELLATTVLLKDL